MHSLTRRAVLASGLGMFVAGCAAPRPLLSPSVSSSPNSSPSAAASPSSSAAALPTTLPWQPDPGDLVPEAKLAAARWVEAQGNDATHRVQILEAQYGGLAAASASVLVVCQSWTLSGGVVVPDGHTFDVRVSRGASGWTVTTAYPSQPGPPGSQSAAARNVLANSRIVLPPAATADVASGNIHDVTLEAMLTISAKWPIAISVIRSGHPLLVFDTNRPSDHPKGLAFDTWRIDGHPVVSPATSPTLVRNYMEAMASLGSYNVGGPQLLGPAPQFFSDQTHHDHVHAGFQP